MKKTCLPALTICTLMSCAFSLAALEMDHEKITPQEESSLVACDAACDNPSQQADAQVEEPVLLACDAACDNPSQQADAQVEEPVLLACDATCDNPPQQADAQVQEPVLFATDDTDGQGEVHILPYLPVV